MKRGYNVILWAFDASVKIMVKMKHFILFTYIAIKYKSKLKIEIVDLY